VMMFCRVLPCFLCYEERAEFKWGVRSLISIVLYVV
jgi:hypothetical protein